jgi:predicted nucleic acid-binding protein
MSRVVVLDAGPLGVLTHPARTPEVQSLHHWLEGVLSAGHRVVVPAIADYEVRRELERAKKAQGLARLDAFNAAEPDRYLSLTDTALRLAARLWAQSRQRGMPTADPKELDGDVLIAAQALSLGVPAGDLVVATTNVGHLSQFVRAEFWPNIHP